MFAIAGWKAEGLHCEMAGASGGYRRPVQVISLLQNRRSESTDRQSQRKRNGVQVNFEQQINSCRLHSPQCLAENCPWGMMSCALIHFNGWKVWCRFSSIDYSCPLPDTQIAANLDRSRLQKEQWLLLTLKHLQDHVNDVLIRSITTLESEMRKAHKNNILTSDK